MTIAELLRAIATTDALPRRWRIRREESWTISGATEPEHSELVELQYVNDGDAGEQWNDFGVVEISDRYVHTSDWIGEIIVERAVPISIFVPFQAIVRHVKLELRPEPEIPF